MSNRKIIYVLRVLSTSKPFQDYSTVKYLRRKSSLTHFQPALEDSANLIYFGGKIKGITLVMYLIKMNALHD